MDSLKRMNEALNYIEENLANDIDFKEVAKIALCSEYHFKRMQRGWFLNHGNQPFNIKGLIKNNDNGRSVPHGASDSLFFFYGIFCSVMISMED